MMGHLIISQVEWPRPQPEMSGTRPAGAADATCQAGGAVARLHAPRLAGALLWRRRRWGRAGELVLLLPAGGVAPPLDRAPLLTLVHRPTCPPQAEVQYLAQDGLSQDDMLLKVPR